MTTTQLRAKLFREMNPLLDSEAALTKLLDFVKTLKSTKKQTKRERQEAYVKESLTRALDEVEKAKREGRKLKTLDDFIEELEKDTIVPRAASCRAGILF